ncbi:uncharacterized protein At4g15970-like [Selaginella moellendorffii]|uniref:uncharacterized protein At4g15970-like n=1 Tax=Selaginella moellendorffii TaxID=88036 RepID=UPI000D1CA453|nr:uncharacterized protein At4g15970-like [Selaginella moellendorffii]|eukprot:XP_024527819.1 uncharacterized protein At4g15970-like [Selaginella moellendorffii]
MGGPGCASSSSSSNAISRANFWSAFLGVLAALVCVILFAAVYMSDDGKTMMLLSRKTQSYLLWYQDGQSSAPDVSTLKASLAEVAFRNKTVILTTLNKSWADNDSMIDAFFQSFRLGDGTRGLLDHLLIVNLDQASHTRCLQLHRHCFKLATDGVDFTGEKVFMSSDYLKMMWRRVEFLHIVLKLGYNFVFTDADIMWFRDPFQHFSPEADFEIACDRFNGNPEDLRNDPNGGFIHAISSPRTIALYKLWYESRLKHPNHHDQDVFNDIKHSPQFKALKLKVRFLDTRYFGGFCQISRDFDEVCTIHANCCTKLERKLVDLKLVLEDWNRYRNLSSQESREVRMFWRAPRECLHSFGH